MRCIGLVLCALTGMAPLLVAQDTEVTAGFHIRGPDHPAGGTRAWCIGEEGLLNPYNNRTTLAEGYDLTLKGEEDWPIKNNFEEFSTPVWTLGEGMSQRAADAPVLFAEIEDLAVDLFDARGDVGMSLVSQNGVNLGLLNRQNFRWVQGAGDEVVKSLEGKANIAYTNPRGNAGGHIKVTCRTFLVTVTVADAPMMRPPDLPPILAQMVPRPANMRPIFPKNTPTYLDGRFDATVTVSVEPKYYENQLTAITWDRVDTDPSGMGSRNPDQAPLEVVSDSEDLTKAHIPLVRWARTGQAAPCVNAKWIIDGTFYVSGLSVGASAYTPGTLTAVLQDSGYINGKVNPDFQDLGGEHTASVVEGADGLYMPVVGSGTINFSTNGTLAHVWCLPTSQFWDLALQHELRHVQQWKQALGSVREATPGGLAAHVNRKIQNDRAADGTHVHRYATEAEALAAADQLVQAERSTIKSRLNSGPATCWRELDADEYARKAAQKPLWWSIPDCRYTLCAQPENQVYPPTWGDPDGKQGNN